MTHRRSIYGLSFQRLLRFAPVTAVIAAGSLSACSSDHPRSTESDGGVDSGTGGRGAGGTAGTGGTTNTGGVGTSAGGTTGTGGTTSTGGVGTGAGGTSNGAGGNATNTGGAGSGTGGAGGNHGSLDAGSPTDAGSFSGIALAGTTDFATASEYAAIDLRSGAVLSDNVFQDDDVIPLSHSGLGFILERTNARVNTVASDGSVHFQIALGEHVDGGVSLNPHDVVPIPGTTKAYVSLYAANRIDIVDLAIGAVTGSIDLSQFLDPSDGDGHVETDLGLYDPGTKRVYFALQRLDLTTYQCPKVPSLLVGIDPTTDSVVDLNASDSGKSAAAIALRFVDPSSLALDGGRLFVLSSGCQGESDGNTNRVHHGIEVVTLATGTTTPVYAPTAQNFLTGISLIGDGSIVNRYSVDYTQILWNRWDLTSPDLGAALTGVPDGAVVETANTLIGGESGPSDDAGDTREKTLVRYDISTGNTSVVAPNPWSMGYVNFAGAAIVQ